MSHDARYQSISLFLKISLNLSTSITMTSKFPLSNHIQNKKLKPFISTIRVLHHKSQNPNQNKAQGEEGKGKNHMSMVTDRRNVLFGLGTATLSLSNQASQLISIAVPSDHKHSSRQHNHEPTTQLTEFGSKPRILDEEQKTIRVLVKRPKEIRTKSKKPKLAELLVVDGIEVHRNGPVRLEVYVAKAHDDVVGPDLGQFAGSLVNLPFNGVGKNGVEVQNKGRLELGIGALVKDLEAQDCEKIAVYLVPRTGQVMIGGLRIEAVCVKIDKNPALCCTCNEEFEF